MRNDKVYPGKHPNFLDKHFTDTERAAIETLSKEFFVTNGGATVRLGYKSEYRYVIISPTEIYKDMFNLDREIVVVFSPYETIQARTLDVFEHVAKLHSALRLEKICNILVSADANVQRSLHELVKSEPESQVIIPFFYGELQKVSDQFFFRNRFRRYFYTRDLFAFEAPLRKDIYFFGRNDLIQELINRLKSGENSGVFGLRKAGKTSLINGIERNLQKENIKSTIVDCQDPSFNQRRWNEALYYICLKVSESTGVLVPVPEEPLFTDKDASLVTETFLRNCAAELGAPLFLIFDEIENISRDTSPAEHWKSGIDFALLWQTLRSIFQRNNNLLYYLIAGTNPRCIEMPKIDHVDNPIFNHFTPLYIPGFEVKDTREMIRKLGRRMGLSFDESVYSKLTEDFGGHPFLMRHVCSLISRQVKEFERPTEIERDTYNLGKMNFVDNHSNYLEMILSVLRDYYPDEFEMLSMLANDDLDSFNEFAELHPSYTMHLIGYGLIRKGREGYDFSIDTIKDYILSQAKFRKIGLSCEDMWAEISLRRNAAEVKLRKLVRILLQANMGISDARAALLDIIGGTRKAKLVALSYQDLFVPSKGEIYFSDLTKVISKHWDVFKNSFERTKQDVFGQLEYINKSRADAHAIELTTEQFAFFRLCMASIEADLEQSV